MRKMKWKHTFYKICAIGLVVCGLFELTACDAVKLKSDAAEGYYFDQPAKMWEATFPLGNGRIGLMPDGGISSENIVMNEGITSIGESAFREMFFSDNSNTSKEI